MVHLPVPDEYTSILRHIRNTTTTSSDAGIQHEHPLTLHHDHPVYNDDDFDKSNDDDVHPIPTCNACVQFISPPFYTCSHCPNLFLHDCCASLPRTPPLSPTIMPLLLNGPNKSFMAVAKTTCCDRTRPKHHRHNQHGHRVRSDAGLNHARGALRYTRPPLELYIPNQIHRGVTYKCATCRNFSIHATCARLPAAVRHVYDPHPLELVTDPPPSTLIFCEVCERGLDGRWWYYGCRECEQAFHVDCIPCLDRKSAIKYEITEVRLDCHECSLTLVRGHMVRGRRCGYCGEGYEDRDKFALECFKCYFGIHAGCAKKILGEHDNPELIRLPF